MTSYATDREIAQQPQIWRDWSGPVVRHAHNIRAWLEERSPDEIWLSGAGTSAFIGDSLATALNGRMNGTCVRAVPSTDFVARPTDYLRRGLRPLVVSFGRSGNSSESRATLQLLDQHCPQADRLNITCNKDSALATQASRGPGEQQVIVLPEACHDAGFAMTSSYTTMFLTALCCLGADPLDQITARMQALSAAAQGLINTPLDIERPGRAVFLGSGPFTGVARESALKVLELSAGQVVTSWDSTLGFRHGPKAVTNADTAVFVYLSSDPLTRKYDDDIASEIRLQFPDTRLLTIGRELAGCQLPDIPLTAGLDDVWSSPLAVILAQRLAVHWSKSLGIDVDDPFAGQNLTRVVADVPLHF